MLILYPILRPIWNAPGILNKAIPQAMARAPIGTCLSHLLGGLHLIKDDCLAATTFWRLRLQTPPSVTSANCTFVESTSQAVAQQYQFRCSTPTASPISRTSLSRPRSTTRLKATRMKWNSSLTTSGTTICHRDISIARYAHESHLCPAIADTTLSRLSPTCSNNLGPSFH